jgi:radical SAM protein with 4Fe4S-binding SPASM domain
MIINIIQLLRCQLKCKFCLNSYMDEHPPIEIFSLDQFKEVVKLCVDFGFTRFDLTPNLGDFLLDRNHIEKLKFLESIPEIEWYGFVTNFLNSSRELLEFLPYMKKGFIEPSVYGYNRKQYKETTGKDFFNLFVLKLNKLNNYIIEKNINPARIRYYLRCDIDKESSLYKEMDFIVNNYNAKVENQELINRNWAGQIPKQCEIDIIKKGICAHAIVDNGIFINGDVTLCNCWDTYKKLIIGNIYKQSLEEIYSEDSIFGQYMKEQMVGIYKGICNNCDDLTLVSMSQINHPWMNKYKNIIERLER